jgi:hypothetical protein
MSSFINIGRAEPITKQAFQKALDKLKIEASLLWAIIRVETTGAGFNKNRSLVVRFESHKFEKFAGKVAPYNRGSSQEKVYERINHAANIDQLAAAKATSYGLGQTMGFNAELVGYKTNGVYGMIATFADFEDAQLDAIVQYCISTGADKALQKKDYEKFATLYNGPGWIVNDYANRIFLEEKRASYVTPNIEVRANQLRWSYKGYYTGTVDGILGKMTREAQALAERALIIEQTTESIIDKLKSN